MNHINDIVKIMGSISDKPITSQTIVKIKESLTNSNPKLTNTEILEKAIELSTKLDKEFDVNDYFQDEIKQGYIAKETTNYKSITTFTNMMNIFNRKSMSDVIQIFNPAALYKKMYISLDSRNAAYNDTYKLVWYITEAPNIRTGFINVPDKLRDIVQIRITNLNIFSDFNYLFNITHVTEDNRDFSSHRLAVYIEDFSQQAFVSPSGTKFHFVGYNSFNLVDIVGATNRYLYQLSFDDQFNNGIFRFVRPVSLFDKITLSINSVDSIIPFYTEYVLGGGWILYNLISLPNQISFDVINPPSTHVNWPFYGQDIQGARILDFNTSDPIADAANIAIVRNASFYFNYFAENSYLYADGSFPVISFTGNILPCTITITISIIYTADFELTYIDTTL